MARICAVSCIDKAAPGILVNFANGVYDATRDGYLLNTDDETSTALEDLCGARHG
jgi:hypothetical protein